MFESIFTNEDVLDGDGNFICFVGVKFLKGFGPWRKDEEINSLYVDFNKATMQEQDEDGNDLAKCCEFELTVKS